MPNPFRKADDRPVHRGDTVCKSCYASNGERHQPTCSKVCPPVFRPYVRDADK